MRNLAGDMECDRWIAEELRRSRIPVEPYDGIPSEVPSRLIGRLGKIEFRRAWVYWVATGPVPIALARELYEDPVGRTDIRVRGHCGCPPPAAPWTMVIDGAEYVGSYHIDSEVGLRLFADAIRSV